MFTEEQTNKLKEMLAGSLMKVEGWASIKTDIEIYHKIRGLLVEAFKLILDLSPYQVRVTIQDKVNKLEEREQLWDYEELLGFIKFAQILSTGLLSSLDDKEVHDYAAPHQAINFLDNFLRQIDGSKYSEETLPSLGATFSLELHGLKTQLEKIDWKKGWK